MKSANYHHIDQQIHQLSQLIAKVNRSLVPEQDDDSHTNLYYSAVDQRIYGRWISSDAAQYILCLDLRLYAYLLLDDRLEIIAQYDIKGRTTDSIEAEVTASFDQMGLKADGLMTDLHFDIPDYSFADTVWEPFSTVALSAWHSWREQANLVCQAFLGMAQRESEIRIWPHHFDTAVYVTPRAELGVGFGLAMRDDMVGDAYYYLAAYPNGYELDYDKKPNLSNWQWEIHENWKGAVLPLNTLSEGSPANQMTHLYIDLSTAYQWMIRQVS